MPLLPSPLPRCCTTARPRQPSRVTLPPSHSSTNPTSTPPRPAGFANALTILAADIKLAHSVFALPFALFGACAAWTLGTSTLRAPTTTPAALAAPLDHAPDLLRLAVLLALVIACMVLARTWAMLFNRIADRAIDARNARTARRALAAGTVSPMTAWAVALLCAALFSGVCALFNLLFANPWPLYLSVPVLLWIAFYSLTKRFTALCHLFLGGALGASPLAAALAVEPAALAHPLVWWVAGFVVLWVAGFDVLYALQDERFDRDAGLKSMPVALGAKGSVVASRIMHAAALLCLLAAWSSRSGQGPTHLGTLFAAAVALVAILLITEQIVLARQGLKGLPIAFFTINGVVSCIVGALGITDLFA